MGHTATILKVDSEIFKIQTVICEKEDTFLKKQLEKLLEKRAAILADMDKQLRGRINEKPRSAIIGASTFDMAPAFGVR